MYTHACMHAGSSAYIYRAFYRSCLVGYAASFTMNNAVVGIAVVDPGGGGVRWVRTNPPLLAINWTGVYGPSK